jgi:hypothetical protein
MDRSSGAAVDSLELALGAAPVSGSSPRVGEKGEELWEVLTEGTKEWHGGGIGRAMVNGCGGKRARWACVLELEGEKRVVGGSLGEVARGSGAFYRAGGEGAEAVGRELGRRLLMVPF